MPADFTAALIAGGKSTRMGRDKATLVIDGMPLWHRQLATLRALQPAELLISGPLDGPWRDAGVDIIPDEQSGLGPLGGLATMLSRMKHERLLVLAVDLPAMTPEFLRGLLVHCPDDRGVVPSLDDCFEPLAAIYPRALLDIVLGSLAAGELSLQHVVRLASANGLLSTPEIPKRDRPLFVNLNAPADLAGSSGDVPPLRTPCSSAGANADRRPER